MPNIDFDAARRERLRRDDPLTFTLGGETFRCRDAIGLADLWAEPPDPPKDIAEGATTEQGLIWLRFAQTITTYIVDDDIERWWSLFEPDHDEIIQGRDLIDIANRLSEEYTGRPLSPSGDSSTGPPATTTGSNSSSEPEEKE